MKKFILAAMLSGLCINACADITQDFQGEDGCFILYNLNTNKQVTEYNPTHCKERVSPDSTFKVALSLMAFDQNLIHQDTIFKWNKVETPGMPEWNQNQTPKTWLTYSVVWVSQQLTPELGMDKIKFYLKEFKYGNEDFSGDPGQDNGLTHAWLSSSLKISAEEQFKFLKNLVTTQLPISEAAMNDTMANMYLETSDKGWKLYGKTGSGTSQLLSLPEGWFIGFIEKDNQTYIFVLNFTDTQKPNGDEAAGQLAKDKVKAILTEMGLY